ncbi:uncharacterized protein LOC134541949 [Bacillus rossius redtenbacheri]|uniref:uncharacterized protein LOC134541949 n=1 Tax=Bacillus rossius redtenbacheri TaxID=93214 RepID=UPI002FDCF5DE
MSSSYKRKSERKLIFSEEILNEARNRILNGESQQKVAKYLGTKESMLRKRLKAGSIPVSLGRLKRVFTPAQEQELADHIRDLDSRFYGIGRKQLMSLAFEYATLNNIPHRFNNVTKAAGRHWVQDFCKRQNLSLRAPEKCSLGRAIGFNRVQCQRFFHNLKQVSDEKKFHAHRIFNMDESGISCVPNKVPKVLSPKGKRSVSKVSSAERGQTVTVVFCMNPVGFYVPPAIIFARKRMKQELFKDAPEGSLHMISDSGFINSDLFLVWLKHFKTYVKPSEDDPVLLILDNHSSHYSLEAVLFCREHNITLLSLPPHATHKLQPLDRGFFGPLKSMFAIEAEKWMHNHPGRAISNSDICFLFRNSYEKVATMEKAKNSFRATGIYPYNPDVFSDEDFIPSHVTDRPNLEEPMDSGNEVVPVAPDTSVQTVKNPIMPSSFDTSPSTIENLQVDMECLVSSENNETMLDQIPSTSNIVHVAGLEFSNADENDMPIDSGVELSTSEINLGCQMLAGVSSEKNVKKINSSNCIVNNSPMKVDQSEGKGISPASIVPVPKADTTVKRQRKARRSEVMTSSPFKNALLLESEKKRSQDSQKSNKKGKSSGPLKKRKTSKTVESDVLCPGCDERYTEPISEDWIQCIKCQQWWHEQCSSFEGSVTFTCDLC